MFIGFKKTNHLKKLKNILKNQTKRKKIKEINLKTKKTPDSLQFRFYKTEID